MDEDDYLDDQEKILAAIIEGIHRARIDFPSTEHGTQRDAIWVSKEESGLFAHAALSAIKAAGFKIVPKD